MPSRRTGRDFTIQEIAAVNVNVHSPLFQFLDVRSGKCDQEIREVPFAGETEWYPGRPGAAGP